MGKNRMLYIDNLRLLMIFFVILIHVAVTYSGFGDWYYMESGQIGTIQTVIFGFFRAFTQGYFMGLLFLIAGYFVPAAYDKKGFGKFVKERIIRLGIPTVVYMLIINPIVFIGLMNYRIDNGNWLDTYTEYVIGFHFINGSGPLWFALALLFFSIIYAAFRKFTTQKAKVCDKSFPRFSKILGLILLISVCAFLIRIVQPIGTNVMNMQLCYFSQYVILFIVGINVKRNNWFEKLDYTVGKPWLVWGISFGFVLFAIIMISGGALDGENGLDVFNGGLYWQSVAYALWESFVSVSMSIGLVALFKEKFNRQNRITQTMSANAFAVYVFHAPVVVALTLFFAPVNLIPIVKFIIVSIVGIPICFLLTNLTIQRVGLLRKLFA